ncbi:hypothetical protein [Ochrobactrum chromiisoli]|uniref:Uncharacterized protein n=1 Tax=Ochrobactrum chromiisoli TaxID=2993941 RepID=A0ABT3QQI5_9HYPH|nr:hypothetical protein [Ochrobactrum chromiisoli]MCX2697868.1 hypothetical protein [Ochrobactrum chromiisoli]
MANELIADAITDYLGERCLDYAEGCPTCEAWAEYDRLYTRRGAAVEGLETVAVQYEVTASNWTLLKPVISEPKNRRELVIRSQAEAIISAERSIRKTAEQRLAQSQDDLKQARANNAALTARVNGFEGFLDDLAEILGCERDIGDVVNELDAINNRAEALEAQLAAARKALEATHEAISEYYRYQYGGEMRGSYDGKPEREGLWKAMYQARAVLEAKP